MAGTSFTAGQTDYISVLNTLLGDLTTYTPTITAGAGTFTSVAATGKYARLGPFHIGVIEITVTTVGTASTSITATLPSTTTGVGTAVGREHVGAGKVVGGTINSGSTSIAQLTFYDNTFPGASGNVIRVFFIYPA